ALDAFPERGVERAQLLEAEAALRARRAPARHRRRLDENRAAAAHRVEQRLAGLPAAQHHDAGGEVLAQRRLALTGAPAALEERLTRGVEIERGLVFFEEGVDAHFGRGALDARALAERIAEAVAHRVLDAQRGELEALERALLRRDVHAQCALHGEEPRPVEPLR